MKTVIAIALMLGATLAHAQCPDFTQSSSPWFGDFDSVDSTLAHNGTVYAELTDGMPVGIDTVLNYDPGGWGLLIHVKGDDPNESGKQGAYTDDVIRFRADWMPLCGYLPTLGDMTFQVQSGSSFTVAKPGDLNRDGVLNITDLSILAYVVGGNPKPDPTVYCDVNDDCAVNMADLILLNSVISGGASPSVLKYGCE